MEGRRSALIVATYEYGDARLSALQAPEHDAEALAEVLGDPDIGGFEVDTVVNRPSHEINLAVARFFSKRKPDDLLLLHFSCHGVKDDSGELYFGATDTQLDLLEATGVSSAFVARAMDRSRAGRILLLLDCCYSGAFARGMTSRAGDTVDINDRLGGRGRAVITASSALQYAFEGSSPASGAGQPSVFTSALVKGLRSGEADRDLDGWVSLDELYGYVHDEVTRLTPDQTPKKWAFDIEGDVYVARRGAAVTTPSELPREIQESISSVLNWEREAATGPLRLLLLGSHPGRSLAARLALEEMAAHDDSDRVKAAARRVLAEAEAAVAVAAVGPPALDHPVAVPEPVAEPEPTPEPEPVAEPEPTPEPEPSVEPETPHPTPQPTPQPAPQPTPPPPPTPPTLPWWRRRWRALAVAGAAAALMTVVVGILVTRSGGGDGGAGDTGSDVPTLSTSELLLSVKTTGGEGGLVAVDVTTGVSRAVLDDPRALNPALSWDRQWMTYMHRDADGGLVPHLARVDGSEEAPLLSGDARARCPTSGRPTMSPDGGRLALICWSAHQRIGLWVVNRDGSGLNRILDDPNATVPHWGGDDRIVYSLLGATPGAPSTLWSVAPTGGDPEQLTSGDEGSDTEPDWSDARILFRRGPSPESQTGDAWLIDQGGRATPLTTTGDVKAPVWSPDGTAIAWISGSGDALWRMDLGGDPVRVPVDLTGEIESLAWN